MDFSPDGKTLVTTGGELVGRLWDVDTGNERLPQEGHRSWVRTWRSRPLMGRFSRPARPARSAGGTRLPGESSVSSPRLPGPCNEMAFAPDGKTLFLGGGPTIGLALWSVAERREIRRLSRIQEAHDVRYAGFFFSTAFSPDGKEEIDGETEGVRIWDVISGKELRGPCGPVSTLITPLSRRWPLRGHRHGVHAVGHENATRPITSGNWPRARRLQRWIYQRMGKEQTTWPIPPTGDSWSRAAVQALAILATK